MTAATPAVTMTGIHKRFGAVRANEDVSIKVDAGTGNDFVSVTRVFAAKDAVFIGGDGFDTFDNNGVDGGEKLEIKEFEQFV